MLPRQQKWQKEYLVDVSHFFFRLGEGEGGVRGDGRGGRGSVFFLMKNPGVGGGSPGREGLRGREGVCGELGNLGGGQGEGGVNIFCSGPKCPSRVCNLSSQNWMSWPTFGPGDAKLRALSPCNVNFHPPFSASAWLARDYKLQFTLLSERKSRISNSKTWVSLQDISPQHLCNKRNAQLRSRIFLPELFECGGPPCIGTHLRTPALKTENFSENIVRFSKTRKWIY